MCQFDAKNNNNLLKEVGIPSPVTGLVLRQPPRDSGLPNPGILVQVKGWAGTSRVQI